ncbi:uncharacterized protein [Physcomitrium patens]|uniref:Uncharacterized protein n=1 Tax=Physcomitrium patens TaxID=3218 RepID=A0A2K1IX70_PHYPA|nr:serine/arginine repetitive matrix protein 2-like [Physcomitrium patens]PNR33877.1 hypothetical protein PHYPA_023693 [Physcomitrium patens]|eukprot:XP_024356489.1 serine/arginine repetitive matrix protein 2-like [Physcomitrella patens]
MAVAAFKSTTRRQWDIRGVEIEPYSSLNTSPTRRSVSRNISPTRRSTSRNPSPTRRSTSKAPSPTRRRSTSKDPSSTRRRSVSKAPSPTRRRAVSKAPSPTRRRSVSKAPSPTRRRATSKAPSPTRRRSTSKAPSPTRGRRGVSRNPSPTRRAVSKAPSPTRRAVSRVVSPVKARRRSPSRNPSPTRGRRGVSRGPSPTRAARLTQVTPPSTQSHPASPSRRREPSVGLRSRATSPQRSSIVRPGERVRRRTTNAATTDVPYSPFLPGSPGASDSSLIPTRQSGIGLRGSSRMVPSDSERSTVRTLASDSESEVEPRYMRRADRTGSISTHRDSSDNESVQSSRSTRRNPIGMRDRVSRRTSSTQMEVRRSLANLELSDSATPVYYQKPKPASVEDHHHRIVGRTDGDVQVEGRIEEKTIQEVHTQTKVHTLCYNCLYDVSAPTDAPVDAVSPVGPIKLKVLGTSREAPAPGDVDFMALYTARCEELRKAVSDARNELENVKEESLRKVIEAKLEVSERKVSELWSQYATEEQRCLHLVNAVKDIKEGSVDSLDVETDELQQRIPIPVEDMKPQHNHRYPMEDMDESDFIRQSLDEEAARYFEECAIIANFDANVIDVDDISVSSGRVSDGETTVCDDLRPSSRRQSSDSQEVVSIRKKEIKPLDDEGMLLPWLDWEPEVDLGRKERIEKAVCDFREWKSAWAQKSVEWGRSSNRERGKDEGVVNVDEFLFERTRLQPRISQGRMLVCGGKR